MNRSPQMNMDRRRSLPVLVGLCAGLLALVLAPAAALAATTTLSSPTSLSGSATLTAIGFTATGAGVTATGTAEITVHWSQPASLGTTFDPNLVRQGRSLDPSDSYTRTPTGTMSVDYKLDDLQVSWDSIGPLSLGSPTYTTSGSCDLMAGGSDYVCTLSSSQITLFDSYPAPGGPTSSSAWPRP